MNNTISKPEDIEVVMPSSSEGSSAKGIIYGSIVELVGTLIVGVLFVAAYYAFLLNEGLVNSEIILKMENIAPFSLPGIISTLDGLLISFYAGYLCAKKSIVNVYRNALILGVISNTLSVFVTYNSISLVKLAVLISLTTITIFLGSFFWKSKHS